MKNNPVKNWRNTKKLKNYLGKVGKLVVWTQVSTAPTGFEYQSPYFSGIIEFEDKQSLGPKGLKTRMPIQIVDCQSADLKQNAKLRLVVRRLKKPGPADVIDYAIKATPI